jgi:hypothetical protein
VPEASDTSTRTDPFAPSHSGATFHRGINGCGATGFGVWHAVKVAATKRIKSRGIMPRRVARRAKPVKVTASAMSHQPLNIYDGTQVGVHDE